ncbi:MAG: hypothetical protein P4L93_02015 [Coriobacteriia bacterium]|nr:hypothetical protein [Coriobacteriia bacterium]
MIEYLRIPKNKFWGWVFSSLAIGLLLGAVGAYAIARASSSKQIDDLKKQVATQTSQAASSASALQAQIDSRDASLTALAAKNTALQQQVDSAKKPSSGSSSSSSSTSSTVTLEVLSRSVSPSTVATGDNITLTAKVQGHPDKVTMRIYNNTIGYDQSFTLSRYSHTSTTETWRRTTSAPKKKGTYRYYATAYLGGKSATMPNGSAVSFKVE